MGQALSQPHQRANFHSFLVERFFRSLTKTMMDGEDIEDEKWGDLRVADNIIEIKQASGNNNRVLLRPDQLEMHFPGNHNDWPFEIIGSWFIIYRYRNRDTRRPKPGEKRPTLLSKCRNSAKTAEVLAQNTRDCFILHPKFLEAVLRKHRLVENKGINFGKPTLEMHGDTFFDPIRGSRPLSVLRSLGLRSARWHIHNTQVEMPLNVCGKDELPLTISLPIYEVFPSSVQPLSSHILGEFIRL